MMEWWYQSAEERMSAPTVYPPPPPPPTPKVYLFILRSLPKSCHHFLMTYSTCDFASILKCVVFSIVHIFCVKLLITKPLVHDYNFKWVCNIFIRLPKMESPYQLTRRSAPCAARSAPTLLFFLFLVLYFATAAYSSPSLRWVQPYLIQI